MDGTITIKTKLDNSSINKDIQKIENQIKKLQDENVSNSKEEKMLQDEINSYEKLCQEADSYKEKIKQLEIEKNKMFKENPSLAVSVDSAQYANIKNQISEMKQKYAEATKEIDKQAPKIDKTYLKLDRVKAKQSENNAKIQEFKQKIDRITFNKVQSGLNTVGKNLQNQIRKIGKLAMAVIGIRTAWYAVRGAINAVAQFNEQVSADFEYMRFCIANMLAPAVQWIIKLLYTVLSYVNAILSAWFGINMFSNSSIKAFQKMKNSAGSTAKSVKEIQKSLQGFDEMNVLQDNTDTEKNSAGGVAPSMDLSGMQAEIPGWLQWIIDNKDLILAIIGGITAGLIALKVFGCKPLLSLGIGVAIAGILDTVQAIIKFLQDPTWENFIEVLEGISIAWVGIAVIFGAITGNWIPLVVAGIIFLVTQIIKYWDEIKAVLGKVGPWIWNNVISPVWEFIQNIFSLIIEIFRSGVLVIQGIFTVLLSILIMPFEVLWNTVQEVSSGIFSILQGIVTVFKGIFTGDLKTVLNGFKQIFKGAFDSLVAIAKAPLNLIIGAINSLIKGANKIKFNVPDWVPSIGGKSFGFNIPQIPKLARGGVISQPTQAIIGEAGKEAVVPLENNLEWLDMLADKLASKVGNNGGYYIVQLDGRTLQRGMAKRKQELAFQTNGR